MSCSVIAEAIQIASRWDARPVRAGTRPPPPRLTSPSSWNVTGPRLETRTSGAPSSDDRGLPFQLGEYLQPVAQQARHQELLADVLLAGEPESAAEAGVLEDLPGTLGALVDARDEEAGDAVLDLQRDPADVTADERPRLPDRLRDGQP